MGNYVIRNMLLILFFFYYNQTNKYLHNWQSIYLKSKPGNNLIILPY